MLDYTPANLVESKAKCRTPVIVDTSTIAKSMVSVVGQVPQPVERTELSRTLDQYHYLRSNVSSCPSLNKAEMEMCSISEILDQSIPWAC